MTLLADDDPVNVEEEPAAHAERLHDPTRDPPQGFLHLAREIIVPRGEEDGAVQVQEDTTAQFGEEGVRGEIVATETVDGFARFLRRSREVEDALKERDLGLPDDAAEPLFAIEEIQRGVGVIT